MWHGQQLEVGGAGICLIRHAAVLYNDRDRLIVNRFLEHGNCQWVTLLYGTNSVESSSYYLLDVNSGDNWASLRTKEIERRKRRKESIIIIEHLQFVIVL